MTRIAGRSDEIKALITEGGLRHVAMIMDGNRRWAEAHAVGSQQGHFEGYQRLRDIVAYCAETLGLPVLTVYAFSTENWQRSDEEVGFLQTLFQQALIAETPRMQEQNLRLRFLGDLSAFSKVFRAECARVECLLAQNTGMIYQVALNYGSRAEMAQACRQIAGEVLAGHLQIEAITENTIRDYLYTEDVPDPDLIIRTGGSLRLSNFLLWQAAYAELAIVDTLWPDFDLDALEGVLEGFGQRQRRFGK